MQAIQDAMVRIADLVIVEGVLRLDNTTNLVKSDFNCTAKIYSEQTVPYGAHRKYSVIAEGVACGAA